MLSFFGAHKMAGDAGDPAGCGPLGKLVRGWYGEEYLWHWLFHVDEHGKQRCSFAEWLATHRLGMGDPAKPQLTYALGRQHFS